MKKKVLFPSILILIVLITLTFFYTFQKHSSLKDKSSPEINLRLRWIHQAQFAGFYTAQKQGFYQQEGLKVNIFPGGVDFPAIQMVAGGKEQFGVTAAYQIIIAREKGIPVVALAVIYRKNPLVFFSLKENDITTPKDFENKKIGIKLGGDETFIYPAFIQKTGIDTSNIQEIPVKYDLSPLFDKQVDVWMGYVTNEPIVAEEQGHPVNIIHPADYGINCYADTLFTTEKMIREHPDIVRKFVQASLKGWEYAVQHPDEAVQYTLTYSDTLNLQHETSMMQASINLIQPDSQPIGSMQQAQWEQTQQLMIDAGFIKNPIDLTKAYTTEFLTP